MRLGRRVLLRPLGSRSRPVERDRSLRAQVYARDKGVCVDCLPGTGPYSYWEADHIVEIADGGPDTLENLATRCKPHHVMKTRWAAERRRLRRRARRGDVVSALRLVPHAVRRVVARRDVVVVRPPRPPFGAGPQLVAGLLVGFAVFGVVSGVWWRSVVAVLLARWWWVWRSWRWQRRWRLRYPNAAVSKLTGERGDGRAVVSVPRNRWGRRQWRGTRPKVVLVRPPETFELAFEPRRRRLEQQVQEVFGGRWQGWAPRGLGRSRGALWCAYVLCRNRRSRRRRCCLSRASIRLVLAGRRGPCASRGLLLGRGRRSGCRGVGDVRVCSRGGRVCTWTRTRLDGGGTRWVASVDRTGCIESRAHFIPEGC
jgi:HNH endonuclease